jgi:hypothetical protein
MQALFRGGRDPYWDDGTGVRRARTKRRVIGGMAFLMAVAACGLTAAMWIRELAPFAERLLP